MGAQGGSTMKTELMPHDHGNARRAAALKMQLRRGGSFDTVAGVFQLLDDGSRVRIFWLLCHCEECVLNISALTDMSSPAVSHHLRLLKDAGLIESRRRGQGGLLPRRRHPDGEAPARRDREGDGDSCPEFGEDAETGTAGFTAEQVETVRRMHDELLQHPEERPTIEELARRCLMNPTTLKAVFKAVYGDSLASHMKEHRLEKAAELLRHGELSVAEIASAVGYDSPSRFSAAFRERYHMLPTEYRKAIEMKNRTAARASLLDARRLYDRKSAVYLQYLPGDVGGVGEIQHRPRDLLRRSEPAERDLLRQHVQRLLPQHLHHVGVDDAGGHRVDADAAGAQAPPRGSG